MNTITDAGFRPRRIAAWLAATVALLVVATLAPTWLLDPPATDGRAGLARWRAWAIGELDVTDEHAASLRAGFVTRTRADGALMLGSADADGDCYKLIVTDGVPVGPSPDPTGDACRAR